MYIERTQRHEQALPVFALFFFLAILGVAISLIALPGYHNSQPKPLSANQDLLFSMNNGQRPADVSLFTASPAGTLDFTDTGVRIQQAGQPTLEVSFAGANPTMPRGMETQNSGLRFDANGQPADWSDLGPAYGTVLYESLYPGTSLEYVASDKQLKGTYYLIAGADPSLIGWSYPGAGDLRIDRNGDLHFTLNGQDVVERAPIAWQQHTGQRTMVRVEFLLDGETVRFGLGSYNAAEPLVIDPELVYSSYLGGNSDESGRAITRDAAGNLYVFGTTYSTDFAGSPNSIAGSDDLFVAKFDPSGKKLLYRTIIGGKSSEYAIGIAVNGAGEVALAATTSSSDFPLKNADLSTQPDNGGAVIKLDTNGQIVFSSYVNLNFGHSHDNIAFDAAGNVVMVGTYWDGNGGRENVGIFSFSPTGGFLKGSQFGGDWVEQGSSLAIGPNGNMYVAGTTEYREGGFPLSDNAFQKTCGAQSYGANDPYCDTDAFVTILDSSANSILGSTYLGGKGSEEVYGIGVDATGNVYVAGTTAAQNFPTKNAFQPTWLGNDNFSNGFVAKLNADLSETLYSTFFSSQDAHGSEYIYGMWVDAAGTVAITGLTNGEYLPLKNPVQDKLDGAICLGGTERFCNDAFVASFDTNGALTFSSYFGAYGDDTGYAIVGDGAGGFWLTGNTEANDFAVTADAAQRTSMFQSDAFLSHVGNRNGGAPGAYRVYAPMAQR